MGVAAPPPPPQKYKPSPRISASIVHGCNSTLVYTYLCSTTTNTDIEYQTKYIVRSRSLRLGSRFQKLGPSASRESALWPELAPGLELRGLGSGVLGL